jgi:(p)ppGpp synthase/HD superfamily hydrolase
MNSAPAKTLSERAEEIARRAHAGQFRRDGITPYITHPAGVAARVGEDESRRAVAWLHDVLEDTPETPDSLAAAGMSAEVIDAVLCLTRLPDHSYENYLLGVLNNPLARAVKIADMLHNLSEQPTPKQIRKYAAALLQLVEAEKTS